MLLNCLAVAAGLAAAYFAFAVLASRVNEVVAGLWQWRAAALARGLAILVGGEVPATSGRAWLPPAWRRAEPAPPAAGAPAADGPTPLLDAEQVRNHPLVKALDEAAGQRRASYLPATTFAAAVADLLSAPPAAGTAAAVVPLADVRSLLEGVDKEHLTQQGRESYRLLMVEPSTARLDAFTAALQPADTANLAVIRTLRPLLPSVLERAREAVTRLAAAGSPSAEPLRLMLEGAGNDLGSFLDRLASWFDTVMERVGGAYKRKVQRWILAYAAVLVLAFNLDTVSVGQYLWTSSVQQAVVTQVAVSSAGKNLDKVDQLVQRLPGLDLPLGWGPGASGSGAGGRGLPTTPLGWLLKVVGLLLSVAAVSFGAPFWFDVLGRVANVRNTGKRPSPPS